MRMSVNPMGDGRSNHDLPCIDALVIERGQGRFESPPATAGKPPNANSKFQDHHRAFR